MKLKPEAGYDVGMLNTPGRKRQLPFRLLWAIAGVLWISFPGLAETRIYAHRGLAQNAPENTMAAFRACVDNGLSIELDVYLSKDGVPVVIHDGTLDRTTSGSGRVTSKPLAVLRRLDAGSWFGPEFSSEKIPTFDEVLQMVKGRGRNKRTHIAINMKEISPGIEEKIVRLVEKHGMLEQVFSFGMDDRSMERFLVANPDFPVCGRAASKSEILKATRAGYLDYIWISPGSGYDAAEAEIAEAHKAGKKVVIYLQKNEPARWRSAVRAGVDGICTDFPLEAQKVAQE